MSRPHNEPAPVPQWPWEDAASLSQTDPVRIDSPLDTRHAAPVPIMKTSLEQAQGPTSRQGPVMPPKRTSTSSEAGGGVRFFVVNHPDKLKDKQEMRKNRQHVMQDYLEKERMKPSSNDLRIAGGSQGRKRKHVSLATSGTSSNPTAPTNIFRQDLARVTPAASDHSTASAEAPLNHDDRTRPAIAEAGSADVSHQADMSRAVTRPRTSDRSDQRSPLITGISGRFRNHSYLKTSPDEVPFALDRLGGSLNPFDTWPTFSDPSVNVNELKWSCSRRFGSRGIAINWVPTLLKARHAFLSTISISSAHDDIMARSTLPPDRRPQLESVERARIRQEVTSMINESMSDPQMQTADATLVAVLHLLNAEIMGCDDNIMYVHRNGLHAMIRQRGGLNTLGVNGELAAISTITMYMIAALRETLPHTDFIAFAQKQDTRLPKDSRPLPESPLYCRPTGYLTINKVLAPDNRIFRLLEAGRKLTDAFIATAQPRGRHAQDSHQTNQTADQHHSDLLRLAKKIRDYPSTAELDFRTLPERYTYEAIRLTSVLYSHALAHRIPFSKAAAELSIPSLQTPSSTQAQQAPMAIHILIRNALQKTDTTDCWGHMAGVLFWIALIAGAAANPASPSTPTGIYIERREPALGGEEEEARKWLAAILVRCSVVMSFEFGAPIMETMKRAIGLQALLSGKGGGSPTSVDFVSQRVGGIEFPEVARTYGPSVPPPVQQVQRGFADFASEFMDS